MIAVCPILHLRLCATPASTSTQMESTLVTSDLSKDQFSDVLLWCPDAFVLTLVKSSMASVKHPVALIQTKFWYRRREQLIASGESAICLLHSTSSSSYVYYSGPGYDEIFPNVCDKVCPAGEARQGPRSVCQPVCSDPNEFWNPNTQVGRFNYEKVARTALVLIHDLRRNASAPTGLATTSIT